MQKLFLYAFSFLILSSCSAQQASLLNADDFEKGIAKKENIQLLDVRTPGEYNAGHISQSLLANWNDRKEFERRVSFLDKNKPIYVYCLAGGRSHAAAEKLKADGFNVFELQGGVNAWKSAGKALEGTPSEAGMTLEQFNGALSSAQVILVDVGAEWCPPCKKMEPVINELKKKHEGKFLLVNVDGGRDQEIVGHYKVKELPVFMVFKDGKLTWRKDGIATIEELESALIGGSR